MITVIRPKACKNCEYWEQSCELVGECNAVGATMENIANKTMTYVDTDGNAAGLMTGPQFSCMKYKESAKSYSI